MAQQTAVEWLIEQMFIVKLIPPETHPNNILFSRAKQMEMEQIMKAVDRGFNEGRKLPEDITLNSAIQYYNETFGNK